MDPSTHEPLSSLDSSYLAFERRDTPMHISATAILERGPLLTEDGRLDSERITKYVESRLNLVPRYRQKLAFTPLERHPIWVDDDHFELRNHVRHTSVLRPGGEREFKHLVGHLLSRPLNRRRPLWEMWLVEGLEEDRFAVVLKVHHCMVDGAAAVSLLTTLLAHSPSDSFDPAPAWTPRPGPSASRLFLGELGRAGGASMSLLRTSWAAVAHPKSSVARAARNSLALLDAAREGLHGAVPTPHNGPTSPRRRVEWRSVPLVAVKRIKGRLGGTVNDALLSITAGALRRFLAERGIDVDTRAAHPYKIVVPVDMRAGEADASGNQVSAYFPELPIHEPSPLERHRLVRAELQRVKTSRSAEGLALLLRFADSVGSMLAVRAAVHAVSRLHPFNLIVTNVAGPQTPLYLLGARLLEVVPGLPLFDHQGLGVAVMSYDGKVCFGLVGDYDLVPDLADFGEAILDSFDELQNAAAGLRTVAIRRQRCEARTADDRWGPVQEAMP